MAPQGIAGRDGHRAKLACCTDVTLDDQLAQHVAHTVQASTAVGAGNHNPRRLRVQHGDAEALRAGSLQGFQRFQGSRAQNPDILHPSKGQPGPVRRKRIGHRRRRAATRQLFCADLRCPSDQPV